MKSKTCGENGIGDWVSERGGERWEWEEGGWEREWGIDGRGEG